MRCTYLLLCACLLASCSGIRSTRPRLDGQLALEVSRIQAIDNHAHPMRVTVPGEKDTEYDALPVEAMEPFSMPLRLRPDNPEFANAWQRLYGGKEAKSRVIQEKGDAYPAWVLDQLKIQTMLANRVAMGRGLAKPRFLWVPFADALLFPLNNESLARRNPEYRSFFGGEEKLLKQYLADAGLQAAPHALGDYLSKVVTATLERQRHDGAVAVKFEAAYLRPLDFADAAQAEAERVYAAGQAGKSPADTQYKILQDFLFRYIAAECGRLGLAVHLHVAAGAGSYFQVGGANPLLLEPVLNDPRLRRTNFVFVHGGWPFTREMEALLTKPNAYCDFSLQTYLTYPEELSQVLREWLEFVPEKVLFGTDASPFSPDVNWEETALIAANSGREALSGALTGMLRDGEVTREHAVQLAHMVLHDNARKLYGLP
ncbi:MAG TPA: amidohydrolase family protein [Bryobacteraceae bacterium]|nr:amidohydrolase family protein [Bryobacteraceae bacterium]